MSEFSIYLSQTVNMLLCPAARCYKEDSHQAQISQEHIYGVRVKTELWPLQNCFVFLQDDRGETKREALFKAKSNKRGRNTSCL